MKKHFITILALCTMAVSASAQIFVIDSGANWGDGSGPTATTGGRVWLDPDGNFADAVLDNTQDINLGVLWGTSATTVTAPLNIDPLGLDTGAAAGSGNWIADQITGTLDIAGYEGGTIFDPNGIEYRPPGMAAGTPIWLILQGWTGSSTTYANALVDGGLRGQTAPFSVILGHDPSPPDTRAMSALVLTPEPSLPAFSVLGGAAFALFRRRK